MTIATDRLVHDNAAICPTEKLRLAALVFLALSEGITLKEAQFQYRLFSGNGAYLHDLDQTEDKVDKAFDGIQLVVDYLDQTYLNQQDAALALQRSHQVCSDVSRILFNSIGL